MGIFDVFRKKSNPQSRVSSDQAVIVKLNGKDLPDGVYENNDLSALEGQIISAIEGTGLGEYDGNEMGPGGASLYVYGPNADKLYQRVENILKTHPLSQSAQITIRQGPPGAAQRQVVLG